MNIKVIKVFNFLAILLLGYVIRYAEHYSEDDQGNTKEVFKGLQLLWGSIDSRVVPENGDPELVYERKEIYFFGMFEESTTGGKDHISWEEGRKILDEAMKNPSLEPEIID